MPFADLLDPEASQRLCSTNSKGPGKVRQRIVSSTLLSVVESDNATIVGVPFFQFDSNLRGRR